MKTKTIKPFNETESGRSMVEMLGVLAIIGVISIGAIAGYTYGMNRYRTNEVLDGGTKRAYTVATQLSMGLQPNLSEFKDYNTTAGGVFGDTDAIKQWDGEFGISITGVSKPVCENLIRMIGDKTPLRALSKGEGENETQLALGDCSEGSNDFYLVYNIGGVGSSPSTESSGSESSSTSSSASPSTTSSAFDESQTFVAGASGTWDELASAPDHGCPDGYTWASKAAAESYASDIANGTKCATCPGRSLWTSTPYNSSYAWLLLTIGFFSSNFSRDNGLSALCVKE